MISRTTRARWALLTGPLLLLVGFLLAQSGLGTAVTVLATTAAVALLHHALLHLAPPPPPPTGRIRTAIRDRALRTAYLPQRDPDAAGRPRPRAPGRPHRTATRGHFALS
ncbi:hypothetical protein E0L36_01385 [Streptomyces sp. AJS327]|uniref:DUF6412 domain-containing protein n=1 Tax=Streptomyces sp. AJS327 TaxID=2545265 RepID=UPI0015E030CE|nr:DUF6412 domain-containing protein [Streptomyces sp. AJS327]MBA0049607.1 hypothetical protein [Streptomyces sp. AJS327]